MSDLIRREEVLQELADFEVPEDLDGSVYIAWGIGTAMRLTKNTPAVDAVEVVRCCRCRFAVNKREHGEMVTYCALDWGMRGVLDPNDYCSYGKDIKRCQD